MKYIVKNGKIFGIAANEWDNTAGIPTINSTILEQGNNYTSADLNIIKHMTKAEYDALPTKNPNCYYVVSTDTSIADDTINYLNLNNKPSINNVILTGNKSLRDLNLYSIDEIDNMMASLRAIKVVATKPATADIIPNTLYYVGTSAPYHVYLYDSNKTEADLGDSNIDFSNFYTKTECDNKYLDKQNFLNNLYPKGTIYTTYENKNPSTFLGGTWVLIGGQDANLNYYPAFAIATDTEGTTIDESLPTITGSYRVGSNLPLTNIKTTDATQPTTADGCFSLTEEQTSIMLSTMSGTSVKPKALNFDASNSSPIYQNNAHVNVNAIKIFFWRRTDEAPVVFNTGNITMDTTLSPQSTNDHIPTSKAVVDYTSDNFASIGTSKYVGTFKTPDNCIVPFGFHRVLNMANERATIEGSFVSQMTDPVDGSSNLFGDLKVRQQCYGGSVAGSATNICIEQTFITYLRGSPTQRKVFFRRGYLANSATDIDINNVEAIKNSLTWMSWYPLEYPKITLSKVSSATTVTVFDAKACVSGGSCFINVRHIRTNTDLSRASSIEIATCPFCQFRKENDLYFGTLYSFDATVSAPAALQSINDGKLEAFGFKANIRYIGTISFPLGY